MTKYFFSITEWPEGLGLDFGSENGAYGFAGACGGGTGKEVQHFVASATRIKELIGMLEEALAIMKSEEAKEEEEE